MKKETFTSLILIVTLIIAFTSLGATVAYASLSLSYDTVIEEGSSVETASYVVSKDGSTYYVKNGETGAIDYSGSNGTAVTENLDGKIYFKSGVYELNMVFSSGSICIVGTGSENTILRAKDSTLPIIRFNGSSSNLLRNVTILDFSIDTTGSIGIQCSYVVHSLTIERVHITDMTAYAIDLDYCWGANIINCVFSYNTGVGLDIDTCHGMNVIGTYLEQNNQTGYGNIRVFWTASLKLEGVISENSIYCVYLDQQTKTVDIVNCHFEATDTCTAIIWIQANSSHPARNINILNNFFEGHAHSYPVEYVHIEYGMETKIKNNYFPVYDVQNCGINLTSNGYGAHIRDNYFIGNGTYVDDGSSDTQYSGFGFTFTGVQTIDDNDWISHNLISTPDILLLTVNANTTVWHSDKNSTHFRIRFGDGGNHQVSWQIEYRP